MILDPETCYRALLTRDPRFDGCFFVAGTSTRVYCRPVCRVRAPKLATSRFFSTPAAAEASGYRPCLRCRPELAPGNAGVDAGNRIAYSAATLIEEGSWPETGTAGLAARLGITTRHLRRVFQREFGVTPVAFAQTQRLLLAKRLLTGTDLSVTDIACAAGFNSLRRLETLFRQRYRLAPRDLRRDHRPELRSDALHFELSYRPPYDWPILIAFLGARTITGVEATTAASYRRIVRIAKGDRERTGWIEVAPDPRKHVLRLSASVSLAGVVPALLARVKHLFDLSSHPMQIAETLGALAAERPGLRVPGAFDGFEIAVRAILGQQVSVAAARTLAGRFAAAYGTPVASPFEGLSIAFPPPHRIASVKPAKLAALGILPSRSRTILDLAKLMAKSDLHLSPGVDALDAIEQLKSIHGIGDWTAQYIAMRALAWPDAFPHTDLGVMKALGERNPRRLLALAERWRPWRAYAVMHLWLNGQP